MAKAKTEKPAAVELELALTQIVSTLRELEKLLQRDGVDAAQAVELAAVLARVHAALCCAQRG